MLICSLLYFIAVQPLERPYVRVSGEATIRHVELFIRKKMELNPTCQVSRPNSLNELNQPAESSWSWLFRTRQRRIYLTVTCIQTSVTPWQSFRGWGRYCSVMRLNFSTRSRKRHLMSLTILLTATIPVILKYFLTKLWPRIRQAEFHLYLSTMWHQQRATISYSSLAQRLGCLKSIAWLGSHRAQV